jgi:ubiquitin C-terminal hydrolase
LTFALNRFEYDKNSHNFIKKLNPVGFEFDLDLSRVIPNMEESAAHYELFAFIVHIGTTPQGGHYITYARNISENPNLWFTFDDGYVTEKEVIVFDDFNLGEFDTPYILFYSSRT